MSERNPLIELTPDEERRRAERIAWGEKVRNMFNSAFSFPNYTGRTAVAGKPFEGTEPIGTTFTSSGKTIVPSVETARLNSSVPSVATARLNSSVPSVESLRFAPASKFGFSDYPIPLGATENYRGMKPEFAKFLSEQTNPANNPFAIPIQNRPSYWNSVTPEDMVKIISLQNQKPDYSRGDNFDDTPIPSNNETPNTRMGTIPLPNIQRPVTRGKAQILNPYEGGKFNYEQDLATIASRPMNLPSGRPDFEGMLSNSQGSTPFEGGVLQDPLSGPDVGAWDAYRADQVARSRTPEYNDAWNRIQAADNMISMPEAHYGRFSIPANLDRREFLQRQNDIGIASSMTKQVAKFNKEGRQIGWDTVPDYENAGNYLEKLEGTRNTGQHYRDMAENWQEQNNREWAALPFTALRDQAQATRDMAEVESLAQSMKNIKDPKIRLMEYMKNLPMEQYPDERTGTVVRRIVPGYFEALRTIDPEIANALEVMTNGNPGMTVPKKPSGKGSTTNKNITDIPEGW